MVLDVSSLMVTFDTDGAAMPNPQTVSITAMLQNISGTAAFTAARYDASNGTLSGVTLGGSGNTRTLTAAQFGAAQYCIVTVTLGALTAQTTIQRLVAGPPVARPVDPGFFDVFSEELYPTSAVAQVQFRRDGTVWTKAGTAAAVHAADWYVNGGSTVGDAYEVRYQVMSSVGNLGDTVNAWVPLTADRRVYAAAGLAEFGTTFANCNFQYFVRRVATGVTVLSGSGYLEAREA
jgi:hypothetical protein